MRTLFCGLVQSKWASGFDWGFWSDAAQALESDHATIARETNDTANTINPEARDQSLLSTIKQTHPKWINRLITGIRTRDYSIRTEQVYLQWVCRFIAYHKDVRA